MFALPSFLAFAGSLTLFLTPPPQIIPVGSEFKVLVHVSSDRRMTLGTDAVLSYDPKMMTALRVKPGRIYPFYPSNLIEIDNARGKLSFSGTVGFGVPKEANGILGEVYFLPRQPGETRLDFLWEEKGTKDSNLVPDFGELDLLKERPAGATLTFRQPSFLEKIFITLQRIFSFEYLRV